jgi:membrane fusion protein (multidrug efflux system)
MESTNDRKLQKRKLLLTALMTTVGITAIAASAYWYTMAERYVSTDNAYTAVEIAQVTPSITGTVSEILVTDTQPVKQGDILVKIDQTDARLVLAQMEADQKKALAIQAAAEAELEKSGIDLKRRLPLAGSGSISSDEITKAENSYKTSKANLDSASAAVTQIKARVEQAQVDFSRTIIRSPVAGIIAKRQVQLGQRVQPGTPLLGVVPVQELHVDANFKEVQLEKVRIGQPVKIYSDIYGKSVTYHGTVAGLSGGSGSAFAAIPAQNATGNWIKVVQRLPVRINLNPTELEENPLKVGLSMIVEIDTKKD